MRFRVQFLLYRRIDLNMKISLIEPILQKEKEKKFSRFKNTFDIRVARKGEGTGLSPDA